MTRRSPTRLRGAIALAIVSLAVASLVGAAHSADRNDEHAFNRVAISAPNASSHTNSFARRSRVATPRFAATRPIRERHIVTAALLLGLGLAIAADLWRRRADARLHHQLRVDAVFARRRGPPLLQLAR